MAHTEPTPTNPSDQEPNSFFGRRKRLAAVVAAGALALNGFSGCSANTDATAESSVTPTKSKSEVIDANLDQTNNVGSTEVVSPSPSNIDPTEVSAIEQHSSEGIDKLLDQVRASGSHTIEWTITDANDIDGATAMYAKALKELYGLSCAELNDDRIGKIGEYVFSTATEKQEKTQEQIRQEVSSRIDYVVQAMAGAVGDQVLAPDFSSSDDLNNFKKEVFGKWEEGPDGQLTQVERGSLDSNIRQALADLTDQKSVTCESSFGGLTEDNQVKVRFFDDSGAQVTIEGSAEIGGTSKYVVVSLAYEPAADGTSIARVTDLSEYDTLPR